LEVEIWARWIGRIEVKVRGRQVLDNGYDSVEVGLPVVCAALKDLYRISVQLSTCILQHYLERDQKHTACEKLEPFLNIVSRSATVSMADNMSEFLKCFGMVLEKLVFLILSMIR
jgi:hypothetical protein